jgi:hypothetical protein
MKLSREEEQFLRHWMYDEVHFQHGQGLAKRLQVQHRAIPADLAAIIAAAFPDLSEQRAAGEGPAPTSPPTWPWNDQTLRVRLKEAREFVQPPAPGAASR